MCILIYSWIFKFIIFKDLKQAKNEFTHEYICEIMLYIYEIFLGIK